MMFYPVNLNVAGRVCLVVGGGTVALRKIRSLLACDACVKVISPQSVVEIEELALAGDIVLERRGYLAGDLKGVFMVFAVTDQPKVQQMIDVEASRCVVLLNSADDPEACDFHVPAQVRRGDLLITVSTGGASPALSRKIRMQLEEEFGPEYGLVVELFARIRDVVVPGAGSSEDHKDLFRKLLSLDIVEHTVRGDWQAVRAILQQFLPPGVDQEHILEGWSEMLESELEG